MFQLQILGPGLVIRERIPSSSGGDTICIKPVTWVPNVMELSYYANGVFALYVLDAVVGRYSPEHTKRVAPMFIL